MTPQDTATQTRLQKQALRRQMRLQRDNDQDCWPAIVQNLCAEPHFARANTILLYSALPDEVPTRQLIEQLAGDGKTVLLPRVVSDTEMEFRRYTGDKDLQQGAFGIDEPTGRLFTDYHRIDVAVVPGMAFDRRGHRLGRGRGYYDRFLSRVHHLYKIGLCFPWQLVDAVPTDPHDILMDCVVSV